MTSQVVQRARPLTGHIWLLGRQKVNKRALMGLLPFVIKFPYNAHSDWLKHRALSENKARVDDGKLAFVFVIRNFDKFDPN